MKPPSFSKDHTKMDVPYIEHRVSNRLGSSEIVKVDIRMKRPNSGDYIDNPTLHSIEHLLAQYMYRYHPEKIIDVSPMGCQSGFYLSYIKSLKDSPIKIIDALTWASQHEESPKPSEKNCGNYMSHNFPAARALLKELAQKFKEEPGREYMVG